MPIYKGTSEVTSGNLYKGTTEIENGYKATSSFYVNELTWTFSIPSVMGNTSVTSNNLTTFTGAPGSAVTGQNFKILCDSGYAFYTALNTINIGGLPAGMTASVTASGSAGPGTNEVLVTLGGVYPQASQNIAITATGATITAYYSVTGTSTAGSNIETPGSYIYARFNNSHSGRFGGVSYGGQPDGAYTQYVWSGTTNVAFYYESEMGSYPNSSSPSGVSAGWSAGGWIQSGGGAYINFTHSAITSNVTLSFNTGTVNLASFSSPNASMTVSCSNYTAPNSSGTANLASPGMVGSSATQGDPRTILQLGWRTTETTSSFPNGYGILASGNFAGTSTSWTGNISNPGSGGTWDGSNPYTGGYKFGIYSTYNVTTSGGATCT